MKLLDSAGLAHFWGRLRGVLDGKQDALSGSAGQIVGFDENGAAVAAEPGFVTEGQMEQAIALAVTAAVEEAY